MKCGHKKTQKADLELLKINRACVRNIFLACHAYGRYPHICPGQDIYVLARTYVSCPAHICPGQDIYVLGRTHMSWPGHICPGQDIYVGTFRTHGMLKKYFGRMPDLFLRVLDLLFAFFCVHISSKLELF